MKTHLLNICAATILTGFLTANGQTKEKNLFPPIDIKTWDKTPCVNGRLATKKETENGTALLYYDKKDGAKPYNLTVPKLAYAKDFERNEILVVVIQAVQTPQDTMVGYRPIKGGNGAGKLHDVRFLTDDEVKKLTAK